MKGVQAVATRILPDLAQCPSHVVATLSDIFRGAKMQFLEGCPGAAKTDLVVCMALWMYTFTDLNIIVTNQQNTSNRVFQETVQKFADGDSEWLKRVHGL
eukprot:11888278-Heterocapsa_arctica.AAC.1